MPPGRYRHLIDIGIYTQKPDGWGDPDEAEWQSIAEVWASVEGLRGNQLFQAQQMVEQADHKIVIRYRSDIEPGMIVRHDGRELTIRSALDEKGDRRELTIICQEVRPS